MRNPGARSSRRFARPASDPSRGRAPDRPAADARGRWFLRGWLGGWLLLSALWPEPAAAEGYPPLRLAGLQNPPASAGSSALSAPASSPVMAPAPAPAPVPPPAPAAKAALVPDDKWCGVDSAHAAPEPPPSCKHPGLPCGPVSADQISRGGGEMTEDLDGDGQPDLILAGHRDVPKPESYAVIYRSTDAGFVLADYRVVPPRAEATLASVVLAAPGSAPLLRDGNDLVEANGRTLSTARLRRFDGQRFRTLLTFCAHRAEPPVGGAAPREGHNRVEIVDVDKDGTKEVLIQGLIRPSVYRFTEGGLGLSFDPALTQQYRDSSPEAQRIKTLRAESARLVAAGQHRRAAETLQRAQSAAPHDVDLSLELAEILLKTNQAERVVDLLGRARNQAPERAAIHCVLAQAHRAIGSVPAETAALRACLGRDPDESLRRPAEARLRELTGGAPAPAPSDGEPGQAPAPQVATE